jgi:hypothetical protein
LSLASRLNDQDQAMRAGTICRTAPLLLQQWTLLTFGELVGFCSSGYEE